MTEEYFKGKRILLIEDEESLAAGLVYNFKEEGYIVTWAKDGKKALFEFKNKNFDLIVLDIMLPYFNGYEIAEKIRAETPQIPILMLTAKTDFVDKMHGLNIGADDYITKPFHLPELLLRIKGMLKRKQWYRNITENEPVVKFGDNEVNFENFECRSGKNKFKLTQREAMVLKYLIENKGRIVSRKELLKNVWNIDPEVETRTVDNFIVRLRKHFTPKSGEDIFIKSVRSAGYIFQKDKTE